MTTRDVGPASPVRYAISPSAAHAHLDDRVAVPRREPQQRQRHADVVVEVALGLEHRVGAGRRGRMAAISSLVVVLPFEPVMATTLSPRIAAPVRARRASPSACAASSTSITAASTRERRAPARAPTTTPRAPAATACRGEVVAVEALAADRDEQRARRARRGCRCATDEAGLAPRRAAAHRRWRRGRARVEWQPAPWRLTLTVRRRFASFASAAAASSRSSKWCFVLPTIW